MTMTSRTDVLIDGKYSDVISSEINVSEFASVGLEIEGLEASAELYLEGQMHGEGAWFALRGVDPTTGWNWPSVGPGDLDSDLMIQLVVPIAGLYAFRARIAGTVDSDIGLDSDGANTGPGFFVTAHFTEISSQPISAEIAIAGGQELEITAGEVDLASGAAVVANPAWSAADIEFVGDSDSPQYSDTVDSDQEWQILAVQVEVTADSDVNDSDNRTFGLVITPPGSAPFYIASGLSLAPGEGGWFMFGLGLPTDGAFDAAGVSRVTLPAGLVLSEGTQIDVTDIESGETGDQMNVLLHYAKRVVPA